VLTNISLRRAKIEAMPILARVKQDAQLLTTLSMDFKTKQVRLSALTSSGAEDLNLERLQSEIQQLVLTGKRVSERYKTDRLAYEQLFQRVKELREHKEDLFHELLSQVQRRTINDCFECQDTSKVYIFLNKFD
jgi:predicted nuclease with TOPRIM domain